MKTPAKAGADPLALILAAVLVAATVAGGVAAFTLGFADAGGGPLPLPARALQPPPPVMTGQDGLRNLGGRPRANARCCASGLRSV